MEEQRVQTAWFVQGYAWLVSAPAVACLLADELVPCLAPENVAFRPPAGKRFAAVGLVDERRFGAAPGDLGRLLASDTCATAFLWAGERLGCVERSAAALEEFLAPLERCDACPLLGREEVERRLRERPVQARFSKCTKRRSRSFTSSPITGCNERSGE